MSRFIEITDPRSGTKTLINVDCIAAINTGTIDMSDKHNETLPEQHTIIHLFGTHLNPVAKESYDEIHQRLKDVGRA